MGASLTLTRMPAYLGIDIDTQSAKGMLLDSAGRILATATRGYAYASPRPGWFEQDPEDSWLAVADIIWELRDRAVEPAQAVGLSGQMHGGVLVDARARPVSACIAWPDARGGG